MLKVNRLLIRKASDSPLSLDAHELDSRIKLRINRENIYLDGKAFTSVSILSKAVRKSRVRLRLPKAGWPRRSLHLLAGQRTKVPRTDKSSQKAFIKEMAMPASKEFLVELKVLTHFHHLNLKSDIVAKGVDVAAFELLAIATPGEVTELELVRAENATKSAIMINLESRSIITEDIGRQILTYGCRKPVEYFLKCLEELTLSDITMLAQKFLSSPLTMACYGDGSFSLTITWLERRIRS